MTMIKWHGARAKDAAQAGARRGLARLGEHVLEQAKRIVPIEEHTLEDSGTVSVDPTELRVAVSFDTPYAVRQHEELDWKHDEDRQAKYLETPLEAAESSGLAKRLIAEEIRREL